MPPQRIVIVGSPGSGKTTLARKLSVRLDLPVIHLDVLYYGPRWSKSPLAEFRARVAASHAGEAWISEGNFASWTFDLRLPRADVLVALTRSRWLCLWRCVRRAILERRDRPDLPAGCSEQIDRDLLAFIWNYAKAGGPEMEAARRAHGPALPIVRLGGDGEIAAFVASPFLPGHTKPGGAAARSWKWEGGR